MKVIAFNVPEDALSRKTKLQVLDIDGTDAPVAAGEQARQPGPEPARLAGRAAGRAQRQPGGRAARAEPALAERLAGPAAPPLPRRAARPDREPVRADPARRAAGRADRRRDRKSGV